MPAFHMVSFVLVRRLRLIHPFPNERQSFMTEKANANMSSNCFWSLHLSRWVSAAGHSSVLVHPQPQLHAALDLVLTVSVLYWNRKKTSAKQGSLSPIKHVRKLTVLISYCLRKKEVKWCNCPVWQLAHMRKLQKFNGKWNAKFILV